MILPTKHLDLETSVVRVAAAVLQAVAQDLVVPYSELDQFVRSTVGESARLNLAPALGLLYLVGRLDYDADADAVIGLSRHAEAAAL